MIYSNNSWVQEIKVINFEFKTLQFSMKYMVIQTPQCQSFISKSEDGWKKKILIIKYYLNYGWKFDYRNFFF